MTARTEAAIQSIVREAAAAQFLQLWRNNVGVAEARDGRPVRYGLCNDSPAMNKIIKSSDLIGITPVLITPQHYGHVLGVFTALEAKRADWKFQPNDEHTAAQLKFHNIVREAGGYAGFVQSSEDMMHIIGRS